MPANKLAGEHLSTEQKAALRWAYLLKGLFVSLEITLMVTVISVLLAYPLAWIIAERVPRRWQRAVLILAILPF